jgi:hypothetical protein
MGGWSKVNRYLIYSWLRPYLLALWRFYRLKWPDNETIGI